ncbi:hypothetical protein [Actinokineospora sp. NPDC004072]
MTTNTETPVSEELLNLPAKLDTSSLSSLEASLVRLTTEPRLIAEAVARSDRRGGQERNSDLTVQLDRFSYVVQFKVPVRPAAEMPGRLGNVLRELRQQSGMSLTPSPGAPIVPRGTSPNRERASSTEPRAGRRHREGARPYRT